MKYETKDKGDIGVAKVIADLTEKDIKVALPISEHLPFDLIAIREDGKLSRISVKYRALYKEKIEVPLRTISSNAQGYKIKHVDFSQVDAYAIYCPNTKEVYYVGSKEFGEVKNTLSLRVSKISDKYKGALDVIRWAKDFLNPEVIW